MICPNHLLIPPPHGPPEGGWALLVLALSRRSRRWGGEALLGPLASLSLAALFARREGRRYSALRPRSRPRDRGEGGTGKCMEDTHRARHRRRFLRSGNVGQRGSRRVRPQHDPREPHSTRLRSHRRQTGCGPATRGGSAGRDGPVHCTYNGRRGGAKLSIPEKAAWRGG